MDPELFPVGFFGLEDGIVGAIGAATETVEDDEEDGRDFHAQGNVFLIVCVKCLRYFSIFR
jgi:hypothetical protein